LLILVERKEKNSRPFRNPLKKKERKKTQIKEKGGGGHTPCVYAVYVGKDRRPCDLLL